MTFTAALLASSAGGNDQLDVASGMLWSCWHLHLGIDMSTLHPPWLHMLIEEKMETNKKHRTEQIEYPPCPILDILRDGPILSSIYSRMIIHTQICECVCVCVWDCAGNSPHGLGKGSPWFHQCWHLPWLRARTAGIGAKILEVHRGSCIDGFCTSWCNMRMQNWH